MQVDQTGTPPLGGGEAPDDRGRRHASRPAPAAHRRGERSRHVERDERDDDALLGDDERAVGGPDDGPETATVVPARGQDGSAGTRPAPRARAPTQVQQARGVASPPPAAGATPRSSPWRSAPGPTTGDTTSFEDASSRTRSWPWRGRMQRGTPRRPRGNAEELVAKVGQVAKETSGDGWADVWKRHHFAAGGDAPLTAEGRLWLPRHLPRQVLRQPAQAPQVAS